MTLLHASAPVRALLAQTNNCAEYTMHYTVDTV